MNSQEHCTAIFTKIITCNYIPINLLSNFPPWRRFYHSVSNKVSPMQTHVFVPSTTVHKYIGNNFDTLQYEAFRDIRDSKKRGIHIIRPFIIKIQIQNHIHGYVILLHNKHYFHWLVKHLHRKIYKPIYLWKEHIQVTYGAPKVLEIKEH